MRILNRTILALTVAFLLLPATFAQAQKQEKSKDKLKLPPGVAELWRPPTDIAQRDLYWGQGGKALQPDLRKVTFIKKETGGYSTKYRVRDASGREWVAKVGKEAKGETAASRLMWATGYFADVNYLVPRVYVEGLNKHLENVRFGLRPKDVKREEGWRWKNNPFTGTREFQGLKIMMAILNNWDIKDSNNKVVYDRDNRDRDQELRYFVGDLGASFGKVSHLPRLLNWRPDRNNPKAYTRTRLIDKGKGDRLDFHYRPKNGGLFEDITIEDARWMNSWLSRLSDRQIEDAFRAANYSPAEIGMLARGVRARIRELSGVRENVATRERRY